MPSIYDSRGKWKFVVVRAYLLKAKPAASRSLKATILGTYSFSLSDENNNILLISFQDRSNRLRLEPSLSGMLSPLTMLVLDLAKMLCPQL